MKYALVFDLGTGSVKASLFGENAKSVKSTVVNYQTFYRDGGIREQCPIDWWNAVCKAVPELLEGFEESENITAIALSGHSLGVVAIGENGALLSEYTPIWSDARAEKQAEEFFGKTDYKKWYECTGNGFPAHLYSVFKLIWYKENMPELYHAAKVFIGTKDYINYMLTERLCTDISYASGSGVFSLRDHSYCEDYITLSGIEKSKFPEICASDEIIGTIKPELAEKWGLPKNVCVVAGGVDNACMSLGAGCFEDGDVYVSLGSSAWAAASTAKPIVDFDRKIYTWEHCVKGMYIPSAGIFSSGTALDWIKENFFSSNTYFEIDKMAESVPAGAHGVVFCPVMSGGSGVDAGEKMKGSLSYFDLGNTKEDILRAVLEGIAYDLSLAVDALKAQIPLAEPLTAVGGGSRSDVWLKIYADIFGMNMLGAAAARDAAALGAAALAFVGTGVWNGYGKIKEKQREGRLIVKNAANVDFYKTNKSRFMQVCEQAVSLADNS